MDDGTIAVITDLTGILTLILLLSTIFAYKKAEDRIARRPRVLLLMASLTMITSVIFFAGFSALADPQTGPAFSIFGIGGIVIVLLYLLLRSSRLSDRPVRLKLSRASRRLMLTIGVSMMIAGAAVYLLTGIPEISSAITGIGILITGIAALSPRHQ